MPRKSWLPLSEVVLKAKARAIEEATGLREFICDPQISIRWADGAGESFPQDADHTPGSALRRSERRRADPRLEIRGGQVRVYPDGCVVGSPTQLSERVQLWRQWIDFYVAEKTWQFISVKAPQGAFAVETGNGQEILRNPQLLAHPDPAFLRALADPAAWTKGQPEIAEEITDYHLRGDHLNLMIGTLGSGQLDQGLVCGGGYLLADGATTGPVKLGVFWGREVLVEKVSSRRFLELFARQPAHELDEEALARRVAEYARLHPNSRKNAILEATGVASEKVTTKDSIWKRALEIDEASGKHMPRRGAPRKKAK